MLVPTLLQSQTLVRFSGADFIAVALQLPGEFCSLYDNLKTKQKTATPAGTFSSHFERIMFYAFFHDILKRLYNVGSPGECR